jgi:GNAT superfamily N-acetyltransferase
MRSAGTVEIRPYRASDAEALLDLSERLAIGVAPWRDAEAVRVAVRGWVSDSIAATEPEQRPIFVAADAQVVGFVTTGTQQHWAGAVDAYVGELVIDPAWARTGIGRRLMERAEDWARGQGHERLTTQTGAGNTAALDFYAALGYLPEDVTLSKPLSQD